jgi:hypothetical protein
MVAEPRTAGALALVTTATVLLAVGLVAVVAVA